MVTIGDKSVFAVQFALGQDFDGVWLNGKICYWLSDVQIGDFESIQSLRDVLFSMDRVVCDNRRRQNQQLFELPAKDAVEIIDFALYTGEEVTVYGSKIRGVQADWARHCIEPLVSITTGVKIFLVDYKDEARILVKRDSNHGIGGDESELLSEIIECRLKTGIVDTVLENTCKKLNELLEEEERKVRSDQ